MAYLLEQIFQLLLRIEAVGGLGALAHNLVDLLQDFLGQTMREGRRETLHFKSPVLKTIQSVEKVLHQADHEEPDAHERTGSQNPFEVCRVLLPQ